MKGVVASLFFHSRRRILLQKSSTTAINNQLHRHAGSSVSCFSSLMTSKKNAIITTSSLQPKLQPTEQQIMIIRRDMMARSSDPNNDDSPEKKACTFIISLGYEAKIAQGVVDALASSGLSGGALLSTVRTLAGRWEVGEDAGLEALVESVTKELARTEGKQIVTFHVLPPGAWKGSTAGVHDDEESDNTSALFQVQGYEGMSITDVAKFGDLEGSSVLGEYLECACSGIMACSTCHIIIDKDWFKKAGGIPEEDEQDMLDLAYNPKETSRLGCQVVLKPELDGMIVKLPKGANNMMDFIPFEDDKY